MNKEFVRKQIENVSPEPVVGNAYRPVSIRIDAGAKKLYSAESKRNYWIEKCADEWLDLCGFDPGNPAEKWGRGMPQALYDLLEAFNEDASVMAAQAFLEFKGYQVVQKEIK